MEIYAENLFIINFSALFLCLAPAVRLFGISMRRHIFASVLGGILSVIIFAQNGFRTLPILNSLFISLFTFRKNLKANIMFFTAQLIMYSLALSLSALFKNNISLFIKNGVLYFNISPHIFILSFLCAYPCVSVMIRVWRSQSKRNIHKLKITKADKTACVTALFDSGNLLTEPHSGKNVILVSKNALAKLEPDNILIKEKPIIIPYRSVGHEGVILGFTADEILIDNKKINNAVIGISEKDFSENCDALIGGI